ncbi:MAG: DMT family transporter [Sutterellaceae bacterium]|nr:DMT family transporter [Sutterellaceae bacterium]MDD7441471.1 DMT family transporter [Sutterellaceae bacterium]MDY2868168.1 DMT family transporter [Mesosutterella sp.]
MPLKNSLLFLLTAMIWGTSFVGQAVGMEYVSPFTFTAGRSLLGALCLVPLIYALDRFKTPREREQARTPEARKLVWEGGILCGIALFAGESFQQFGLLYTPVGKAGFITSLYIIFVPLFSLFLGKKPSPLLWAAVAIAVAGLYLLSVTESLSIGSGDLLCMCCAICYALQIMAIDRYAPKVDGVRLSCIMFLTGGILGLVFTLLFEPSVPLEALRKALPAILYVGILSNGVAYTLQVIAQRGANPTIASLIMSLESVFAALSGWLFLHQILTGRELAGCVLMGFAIVAAQIPTDRIRLKKKRDLA